MLAYLDTLIGFAVIMLGASLVITILTQMISALFSHRGANLLWGLETMFKNLPACPLLNDAKTAEKVAKSVLTHPLISDSIFSLKPQWLADRIRLAQAIDPDELIAILRDLSTSAAFANLQDEIEKLIDARNPEADRRLMLLIGSPALAGTPAASAAPLLKDALNSIQGEAGRLEAWFNSTMDRVSARFTTYVRLWTVAFALALALGTGLDSVALLNDLYTNGSFRQAVAGSATQMTDLAGRVLPNGPNDVAIKMYTEMVNKAITDAKVPGVPAASGIASETAARSWLTMHVTDSVQQSAALSAFDRALTTERVQDAAALHKILNSASFDVRQFRWKPSAEEPWWQQVPGVLLTAGLLSLGAPFWFNMLKQLTGLRPILANKQDDSAS